MYKLLKMMKKYLFAQQQVAKKNICCSHHPDVVDLNLSCLGRQSAKIRRGFITI